MMHCYTDYPTHCWKLTYTAQQYQIVKVTPYQPNTTLKCLIKNCTIYIFLLIIN